MNVSRVALVLVMGTTMASYSMTLVRAQATTNFAGSWVFNPARSQNIGMMASMEDTVTIAQTPTRLTVTDRARMQGQDSLRDTQFDLT